MPFFLSTRHIPQLANLSLSERMIKVREAEMRLTPPQKLILNLGRLLILVPTFVLVLRTGENGWALLWAVLIVACYPILLKPLQLHLCAKHIK